MGSCYEVQNEESINRGFLDRDYLDTGFDVFDGMDNRNNELGRVSSSKSVNDVALDDGNTNDTLGVGIQAEEPTG